MGVLRFTPHLRVEPVPGEAVYLVSERGVTALHGRQVAALAPLLDGTRDLAALSTDASDPARGPDAVPAAQTARIVARLRAAGLVYESDRPPGPEDAYWSLAGAEGGPVRLAADSGGAGRALGRGEAGTGGHGPSTARPEARQGRPGLRAGAARPAPGRPGPAADLPVPGPRTRSVSRPGLDTQVTRPTPPLGPGSQGARADRRAEAAPAVALVVLGCTDPEEARRALGAAGLRGVAEPAEAGLTVVVCDDYLDPGLSRVDAEHRTAGRRWLPVKPVGVQAWFGPVLGAPDGPCWSCMADRLWRGRRAEAHLLRRLERDAPLPRPPAALPASRGAALQLAALEAAGWLAGHRHPGQDALCTLDCLTATTERHPVRRLPQCPTCGDPKLIADRVWAPVRLTPRGDAAAAASSAVAMSPSRLLAAYGHLVSPVTGLVTRIQRDPRGPAFLNCFHAPYRPAPSAPGGLDSVRAGLRAAAHGKGATADQARAGALLEALEHHSGHFTDGEPRQRARWRDLGAGAAVHPDAVQLYAERQFAERDRWNAAHAARHWVCDPFDENAEVDWTPVWSLSAGVHRLMPTALLYYDAPQAPGRRYCLANSNGAAAGGSLADAALRGFLELVERDAVALWWYNRTRQPGLALDADDAPWSDPWIAQLRRVHAAMRREVWALDLTADLGIPVVAALSRRVDKPAEDIVLGFGADFDRHTALRRALTELNQMLPPVAGARLDGGGYEDLDPEALRWFSTATLANQTYLSPDPAAAPLSLATCVRSSPDPAEAVAALVELLRARGLELLVLDQTRPDVGLPVAKVFVPGLRPHWARFAPGRLFEVPVALGRLTAPTPYDDLNPVPLFL
ncbi:TOMM precursor leader peptide-binding protein [Streptomyces sp. LX-29]|uniref:TOMM precursor leader peptide-binding protein n=1 Tax=Streptomyces sp. LX-29 TaxID=2900152 RepID=UPI00240E8552|nr:TOMM precursor leader peptide-binding protein [Streptomyces sp. LX-29]WFB09369.1 TOMM precursor leader peptide-binding protein [Streptomyces sp. LX-29]